MDTLRDLSTREKQAYGALCLHRFCVAKSIEHKYTDELIEHLLSILIIDELYVWEEKGAVLELSGRGDPIPEALEELLADDVRRDFSRLVEFVVEIGFVNMYGKVSMDPLNFLLRSLTILDNHGVEGPDIPAPFKDRAPRDDDAKPYWGETISQEQYEQVRTLFH